MSNDLIKRLRKRREFEFIDGYERVEWEDEDALEAADRIEELERERDEAEANETLCSNMAVNYFERAETAEAKLAKAVEALREIERHSSHANYILVRFARIALAELEGGE
jgi:hypothetical protein